MDTGSFIVHVKVDDICKDIAEDVDTSIFEIDRPLLMGKNEKVIGLMKDEAGGQIMKEFVRLRAKAYSYLKHNNGEDEKAKGTKKYAIKKEHKFKYYHNCLRASQIENILKFLEKKKLMYIVLKKTF